MPKNKALTPPKIPTQQELYDSLMSQIEPELVSGELNHIKEKSAADTPEAFIARKQRYVKAFERYDKEVEKYLAALGDQVRSFKRTALTSMEQKSRTAEEQDLSSLESAMASL
ncbi:MAG: hypothetical protein WCX61_05075 [Candidatus Peribacteraceae bacterium]